MYMYMRGEKEEERSKPSQTNNRAKHHSTPEAVTFHKKNELPSVLARLGALAVLFHRIRTTSATYHFRLPP